MGDQLRKVEELTPHEAMRLLGSVSLGRVVFTARALPAVSLVSHLVDGDHVIVRAGSDAAILSAGMARTGTVVAFEADAIDPAESLGWSVTVIGVARPVTDPDAAAAFLRALRPWTRGGDDQLISIDPGMVTGFRLVPDDMPVAGGQLSG